MDATCGRERIDVGCAGCNQRGTNGMDTGNGWGKRWLLRGVRLGLLMGLATAGLRGWQDFQRYQSEAIAVEKINQGYACAAKLTDEVLTRAANVNGVIDISRLGCETRTFYVRLDEVRDFRNAAKKFETYNQPYHLDALIFSFIVGFLALLTVTLTGISAIKAELWVWGK